MWEDSWWNVANLELGADLQLLRPLAREVERVSAVVPLASPFFSPRVALVTDASERSAVVGGAQIGSRNYTCSPAPPACK